jgi:ankyrin repeat protein
LRLLKEAGCDLDKVDDCGRTPAFWAACNGNEGCLRLLYEAGCDLRKAYRYGETLAHYAACNGHESCLRLLHEADCDLDQADINGYTPAYNAAHTGNEGCLCLLKELREANMARRQEDADRVMRELLEEEEASKKSTTKKKKKKTGKHKASAAIFEKPGAGSDYPVSTNQTTTEKDCPICLTPWKELKNIGQHIMHLPKEDGMPEHICCYDCWNQIEQSNLQKRFIECPLCRINCQNYSYKTI